MIKNKIIGESFIWAKLRTRLEGHLPDHSEKLLQRNRVSSPVLYFVRRENIKQVRITFLQDFKWKKLTSTYRAGQYGLGTWEESLITEGGAALVSPEERHLIFIFNMDIFLLLVNVPFSLVIKAKIQYMFARPQTGRHRWPKIQVNSCISQNDFPIFQHMKIFFYLHPWQQFTWPQQQALNY